MTNATLVSSIDDAVGTLERAIGDIFGYKANASINGQPFGIDNSGRLINGVYDDGVGPAFSVTMIPQRAAGPVGRRIRDTTNNKELRIVANNQDIEIDENTATEASAAWANRLRIAMATGGFGLLAIDILRCAVINVVALPDQQNVPDVDPGAFSCVRFTGGYTGGPRTFITGMVEGVDGQLLLVIDDTVVVDPLRRLNFVHDSTNETIPSRRIYVDTSGVWYSSAGPGYGGFLFVYDGSLQRWIALGHTVNVGGSE